MAIIEKNIDVKRSPSWVGQWRGQPIIDSERPQRIASLYIRAIEALDREWTHSPRIPEPQFVLGSDVSSLFVKLSSISAKAVEETLTMTMTQLREQAKEAEIQQLKDQLELIRTQRKRDIASAITCERDAEILQKIYSKTVVPLEQLRVSVDADDLVSAIAALSRADLIYVREKSIFITSQGIRIVEKYVLS